MTLGTNLRHLRQTEGLTQENLAEIFHVSAGAIYKWESGRSTPDLGTLMALADYFDVSVDALIGYDRQSKSEAQGLAELKEAIGRTDPTYQDQVEQTLRRYPNSLDLHHQAALYYYVLGLSEQERSYFQRALDLYERCLDLLPRKPSLQINEWTLRGEMANVSLSLDEEAIALDLLYESNLNDMHQDQIGWILAKTGQVDSAKESLSQAFIHTLASWLRIALAWIEVAFKESDWEGAQTLIRGSLKVLAGLVQEPVINYLSKIQVLLLVNLAYATLQRGDSPQVVRRLLEEAYDLAQAYDHQPSDSLSGILMIQGQEGTHFRDSLPARAQDVISDRLNDLQADALMQLWKEVISHE